MKRSIIISLLIVFTIKFSNAQTEVTFYTNMGDFTAVTYDTLQPITAGNFLSLVNSEFYDDVIFHRIIDGFMIQGGDPSGTGAGGPGYSIDDEFDPLTSNTQGALAMANAGPNTGGSQFFINLVDNTGLDPNYPVFGMVTSNFNIVQNIGGVSVDGNNRPYTDVVMDSIRVTSNPPLWIVKENAQSINIDIYPNPTTGKVQIKNAQNSTIEIISIAGKSIKTINATEKNTVIDLSTAPKGIYFVKVSSEKGVDTQKLILE